MGLGACTPGTTPSPGPAPAPPLQVEAGLPPVPMVEGPLAINVVHPTPNMLRPNVDSVYIYGSVGTGRAQLTINGTPVKVEPNGAFLGWLERPANDTLRLFATAGGATTEAVYAYRAPAPRNPSAAPATPVATVNYSEVRLGRVIAGSDTLATGSDAAVGRPTPTGPYRWFLPIGARLMLTGERGEMVRAAMDDANLEAWFLKSEVEIGEVARGPASIAIAPPTIIPADDWTDVLINAPGIPFRIDANSSAIDVLLHGAQPVSGVVGGAGLLQSIELSPRGEDAVLFRIKPNSVVWGYKAFYDESGALVIRVRRPPTIDPAAPLRGIRIMIDAGHPPGGATGPTKMTEAEANLGISLRLAEQLRVKGAEVLMTRTTASSVELESRVVEAVAEDADLLVSVHNNAFPEGVNPFTRNGTSTYYYHDVSRRFAEILNEEIVATTRIRDLGALSGNLALVRPTWMPSVLTESLFMPIPEQEAALRNSNFVERLAAAHVRGIERFLTEAANEQLRAEGAAIDPVAPPQMRTASPSAALTP